MHNPKEKRKKKANKTNNVYKHFVDAVYINI